MVSRLIQPRAMFFKHCRQNVHQLFKISSIARHLKHDHHLISPHPHPSPPLPMPRPHQSLQCRVHKVRVFYQHSNWIQHPLHRILPVQLPLNATLVTLLPRLASFSLLGPLRSLHPVPTSSPTLANRVRVIHYLHLDVLPIKSHRALHTLCVHRQERSQCYQQ